MGNPAILECHVVAKHNDLLLRYTIWVWCRRLSCISVPTYPMREKAILNMSVHKSKKKWFHQKWLRFWIISSKWTLHIFFLNYSLFVHLVLDFRVIVHQFWIYKMCFVFQQKKHYLYKVHLDKTTLTRNNWENRVL